MKKLLLISAVFLLSLPAWSVTREHSMSPGMLPKDYKIVLIGYGAPNSRINDLSEKDSIQPDRFSPVDIPGMKDAGIVSNSFISNDVTETGNSSFTGTSQVIVIPEGWSGFSSYVVPDNLDIESIMAPYSGQLVILYNLEDMYYPSQGLNTLVNWDPYKGYIVKFNDETEVEFSGSVIDDRTLWMNAGWNLMPVLSDCQVNIEELFEGIQVVVIKEVAGGKLYWPSMGINTLGDLQPGKAYFVLTGNAGEIAFPDCGAMEWSCGDKLYDARDGKTYNTVQIGQQCWMQENLNFAMSGSNCYNENSSNCEVYGRLYNWEAASTACPSGWHLPSDTEWCALTQSQDATVNCGTMGITGTNAGGKLKEVGTIHWQSPNAGATNSSGFTALPGGYYWGAYYELGTLADFWTSTSDGSGYYDWWIESSHPRVTRFSDPGISRFSVRCIKDCTMPTQAEAGPDQTGISGNETALQGNTPVLGTGNWTIITGIGGIIADPGSGNSLFSGLIGNTYILRWTITNTCGSSFDDVVINFLCVPQPTTADAGTDQFNVPGNSTLLQGNLPVNGTGYWNIISGIGGNVIDPSNPSTQFTGLEGNAYTLKWTISTICNASHDIVQISFEGSGCGSSFVDTRNNKAYNTVQIGSQCWMRENLDYPSANSYCYNENDAFCQDYGRLYDWNAAMTACPSGWHLPSDAEWCTMTQYLDPTVNCGITGYTGTNAGGKLKEAGTAHWQTPNTGATNSSGFYGLPAGYLYNEGFYGLGTLGDFWTSSSSGSNRIDWWLESTNARVTRYNDPPSAGFSVRCIKDCQQPAQSDAGPDQLNVPGASATLQGNVPDNGTGQWSIVSGTGGVIVDPDSASGIFHGLAENTYTLRWSITNECNTSWDEVTISFATFTCDNTFLDTRDSTVYHSVQIGTQCWMKENLNYGSRVNGSTQQTNNAIPEKYCYNDDETNCDIYGGLYKWSEMMQYASLPGMQGLCQDGWHIPTDEEWCHLAAFLDAGVECQGTGSLGANAGGQMKEPGNDHWIYPNSGATNSSGFTGLPSGLFYNVFSSLNTAAYYWTSSLNGTNPFSWNLTYDNAGIFRFSLSPEALVSVRCIRADRPPDKPSNPDPEDQAINVGRQPTLSWSSQDLDNDQVTFDIYFGDTPNPSLAVTNYPDTFYIPAQLNLDATYYWKIVARSSTLQTSGDLWSFTTVNCTEAPGANAGPDQHYNNEPTTILEGNAPASGSGFWNIISGIGGIIAESDKPNSSFSGILGHSYKLRWTITNDCGVASDDVYIWFCAIPTTADAGTDQLDLLADSTSLQGNTPVNSTGYWSLLSGTGGYIADPANPVSAFYGLAGKSYALKWAITSNCYQSTDTVLIRFVIPFSCNQVLTDTRDGKSYNTILVGTQCWMKENLNFGTRINGTSTMTNNSIPEKYCYNNSETTCNTFGGLYQWDEAMLYSPVQGSQGLCPAGWHIPANDEWTLMVQYLGGSAVAGGKMKETGITHWSIPNSGATNSSGLTALPGGYRTTGGSFSTLTQNADFLTSSQAAGVNTYQRKLFYNSAAEEENYVEKTRGLSIRCINNCMTQPSQSNAGPDQLNHILTPVILAANTPTSGYGQWSIVSGSGGSIADTLNPTSQFTGEEGKTYTLQWTISTACGTSSDQVTVSFVCIHFPSNANAGPNQLNLTETSVQMMGNTPTTGTGLWSIISGTGGSFLDPSVAATWFTGTPGNSYTLRWTISTPYCGSDSDDVDISFWGCGQIMTDLRDAKTYPTVMINNQCWMKSNLNYGSMVSQSNNQANNGTPEKYCYNNLVSNCNVYGGLYQWNEAMQYSSVPGTRGLCPDGWHIPADAEWCSLTTYLDGTVNCPMTGDLGVDAGGKLKETGVQHWAIPNSGATNTSGYTGLPGGYTHPSPAGLSFNGYFWTSSLSYVDPFYWRLDYLASTIYHQSQHIDYGYSLRCVKDCSTPPTTSNAGPDQINISGTNTMLQANTPGSGTASWNILSGTGGAVLNPSSPTSQFTGYVGESYILRWTISTECESSFDDVIISFLCVPQPTQADAGPDQLNLSGTTAIMQGNTPVSGTGQWTNTSIYGGSFSDPASPSSSFTCLAGTTNFLKWTITNSCGSTSDFVTISFCPVLPVANAGPDQPDIPGASTSLQGNAVSHGGQWSIISGTGGIITSPASATSAFYGVAGNSYTLRWTITSSCASSTDEVVISFAPFTCGHSFWDTRDYKLYNTTPIGVQCWMKENLDAGTMIQSVNVPENNSIIEKYCYNDNAANCQVYGGLYIWDEMMGYSITPGTQGICPEGWHIPSDDEFCSMVQESDPTVNCGVTGETGTDAGGKLKETGISHWASPNFGATNASGFTALPGGWSPGSSTFNALTQYGFFWTSSLNNSSKYYWYMNTWDDAVFREDHWLENELALSVRCLKTCNSTPTDANAGPDQLNLAGTTATLHGNTPATGNGHWTIVGRTGGTIAQPADPLSAFTGLPAQFYTLRWIISTNCDSKQDEVSISFAQGAINCGEDVFDGRDGKNYQTKQIGNQCWMKQNLNFGTLVPVTQIQTNNSIPEKYCYYNNPGYCATFGGLYQWDEMMNYSAQEGTQGICMPGWHIPSGDDWCTLASLQDPAVICSSSNWNGPAGGGKMKSTGTIEAGTGLWNEPNTGATNSSGFAALPAGYSSSGYFMNKYSQANFWSSVTSGLFHRTILLSYNSAEIESFGGNGSMGHSVRCIRDCEDQPTGANAGPDQPNVPSRQTTLQANTPANGSGHWSIVIGDGGYFSNTGNPTTVFHGQYWQTYVLKWTISTTCASSFDEVEISMYCPQPTPANAGQSQFDIPTNFTYLQANTPVYGTGQWSVVSGSNGYFSDPDSPVSTFIGQSETMYELKWKISSDCGQSQSFVNIGFGPFECGQAYMDKRDHNMYNTTGIGIQCWMRENMNFNSYTGSCPDNLESNCDIYGRLYSQDGISQVCPTGWHIPQSNDWATLLHHLDPAINPNMMGYIETVAGGKLKSTGTVESGTGFWHTPNTGATNSSGFNAFPSGYMINGSTANIGYNGYFWTNEFGTLHYWAVQNNKEGLFHDLPINSTQKFSVRCIRICDEFPSQAGAGPDQLNVPAVTTFLQGNTPVTGWGEWSVISGEGGYIAAPNVPTSAFTGLVGTTYVLRWTIQTSCASQYDDVTIGISNCINPVSDPRDGQVYEVIQIGNQCWMKENLNYGNMINAYDYYQSDNNSPEKYCQYNNPQHCDVYGGLYSWNEMMQYSAVPGGQGLCPPYWHIPTADEWAELSNYLGGAGIAGGKMKETGTLHWLDPNVGATNECGFTAFGGGTGAYIDEIFFEDWGFSDFKDEGYWWSSTPQTGRKISHGSTVFNFISNWSPSRTNSVRCIRNY